MRLINNYVMMLYWRKQDACNLVGKCYKHIVSVTNTPLTYSNGHINWSNDNKSKYIYTAAPIFPLCFVSLSK